MVTRLRSERLRPGDFIRVVAPSGPIGREPFIRGAALLKSRYQLGYDERILDSAHGYLAANDEHRLTELLQALMDPKAAAVILARGGYGLLRLLDRIPLEGFQRCPKPIIGFSDGTLLLAIAAQAGLTTIHGPVVTQLGSLPAQDFSALVHLLEEPEPGILLDGLYGLTPGCAEGPLLGGNLEVFSRLIGTPFLPDLEGAVLLIEDVGERPYRLDRLLTHLTLAGVFAQVSAVLVGDFIACEEPAQSRTPFPTAQEVVCERLARCTIPVAWGAPVGHGARNRPLPYGAHVALDTQAGTLTALSGVVR